MNANVVTAKQMDAPFGIERVPAGRGFGIPRQFEHHALRSRPAARGRLARLLGARQLPTIGLISLGFFEFTEPLYLRLYPDLIPLVRQPTGHLLPRLPANRCDRR
jgi:hypothetical protein